MTNPSSATHVYVVGAGRFSKIGITRNIDRRMEQLRVHCPLALRLHACIPVTDPRRLEIEVHRRLASVLEHGEWFRISGQSVLSLVSDVRRELWPETRTAAELDARYREAVGMRRGPYKLKKRRPAFRPPPPGRTVTP